MSNEEIHPDADAHKGAVEDDQPQPANQGPDLSGQIAHRGNSADVEEILKGSDSDFPEPGSSPEHSGQHK